MSFLDTFVAYEYPKKSTSGGLKSWEFAHYDTTYEQKLDLNKRYRENIQAEFPNGPGGLIVGLVGAGTQANRHVNEFESYGYSQYYQIMVDWSETVFNFLYAWKKKVGYKGQVVCDDIINVIYDLWDQEKYIGTIDYDGTSMYGQEHEDLIKNASDHNVKVIIMVGSARCGGKLSDWMLYWKKRSKANKWLNNGHEPIREITQYAITHIAEQYGYKVCSMDSYIGVKETFVSKRGQTMLAFLLIKK